ncbi:hypothetical protein [Maricaulis sp.]|uniref:hypothetical protein n=1 Tax=Maricaulis sp. TaxID=1486257 RepID=UPI0025BE9EAF|nr:hypothetical protein [Maricaulis sp.]
MLERLEYKDFLQATVLGIAICLALLAIKFEIFGWIGVAASLVLMVALFCAGQSRLRRALILPAILLGGLGYSAASATVAGAIL